MAKRRKTRQEKIILQLKRELAKKSRPTPSPNTKAKPSQEAISKQPQADIRQSKGGKKSDKSAFSYNARLVKKDLLKTLLLTAIILSLEFVLYLKLR